ncbi:MAG: hypothetical protein WCX31_18090 [Salinivirgaceae bacterium]|jgi:hypothetical protein
MKTGFISILIFFFVLLLTKNDAWAQEIRASKDSTDIYKNIQTYSKKNKFTKLIYSSIFRPIEKIKLSKPGEKKAYKKLIKKSYHAYEGKTIREINITTLDPFKYSITDTSAQPHNFLVKTGNSLHLKTLHVTIRNLLLIRQNQSFDSLLVKESERLVRSQSYIRDVSFTFSVTAPNSDSVDIFIRELDRWSMTPYASVSNSHTLVRFTDKNFGGFGHTAKTDFSWYYGNSNLAYGVNYYIPNILNTYINSTVNYSSDEYGNYLHSFAVDRPFFSPLARWAAGIKISKQFQNGLNLTGASPDDFQKVTFNTQDYWAGQAFQIFKGNSEYSRSTNLIIAGRFLRVRYLDKPIEFNGIQNTFSNENFMLTSIGISSRKYVQDKYIFNFGTTEDVPIGRAYSLTGGYQIKNERGRNYLGARISHGYYYSWGYLSSTFEFGTFFNTKNAEQGVFKSHINFFTGLTELGKWRIRQFIKQEISFGSNSFRNDSLTLNDGFGLSGFTSSTLSGTRRLIMTLQTQFYAPWNIIGFRIGPFVNYSFGFIGGSPAQFNSRQLYSQIGVGILIKNDNLVFNTFQLSFSYYPVMPDNGYNVFKANSFRTTDFGFNDFEVGKPEILDISIR